MKKTSVFTLIDKQEKLKELQVRTLEAQKRMLERGVATDEDMKELVAIELEVEKLGLWDIEK